MGYVIYVSIPFQVIRHQKFVSIRVICYCYEVWYKEENKEASKPAFLYTDTIRYDTINLYFLILLCTHYKTDSHTANRVEL